MKRLAIAVLVVFMATTALAAAGNLAATVKTAELPAGAAGQEMTLAALLAVMSERTGASFVPVPAVAELKVALPAGGRLTVGEAMAALTARYGMAFRRSRRLSSTGRPGVRRRRPGLCCGRR